MLRHEALARQHGEGVARVSSATRWWCDAIIFRRIGAMPTAWCDAIVIMERVGVKPKNVAV
jgi:hypothetical protein